MPPALVDTMPPIIAEPSAARLTGSNRRCLSASSPKRTVFITEMEMGTQSIYGLAEAMAFSDRLCRGLVQDADIQGDVSLNIGGPTISPVTRAFY